MEKINKRKVLTLILSLIFLIVVVKAFSNSQANKLIEITAVVEDNRGLLKEEEIKIQATKENNKGVSITLPNIVNGKIVSKYYVEEKELKEEKTEKQEENQIKPDKNTPIAPSVERPIEENKEKNKKEDNKEKNNKEDNKEKNNKEETNKEKQENKTEENNENKEEKLTEEENKLIVKSTGKIIEKKSGEKIYLTEEEVKNKKIKLKTEYEIKEAKGKKLYKKYLENKEEDRKKELETEKNKILEENKEKTEEEKKKLTEEINTKINMVDNNIVIIEGYMPANAIIKVRRIENKEIEKIAQDKIHGEAKIKVAYDIKIIVDGKEFEPNDFDENVQVIIKGEDTKKEEEKDYKILHIKDDKDKEQKEEIEEINEIEVKEDKVKFNAKEFSTYALVEEPKKANTLANTTPGNNNTTANNGGINPSAIIETQTIWDGTIATEYTYGNGSQQEPFLIGNGSELAFLAQNVNNGEPYEGKYFQLIDDIDLGGNSWRPIGNANNSFKGIFDGAGHTIANGKIDINQLPKNQKESYGIFGSIGGSWSKTIIRNIEISGMNIYVNASGDTNVGIFDANSGGINVGTLVGTQYKNTEIRNVICKASNILDTNGFTIKDNNFNFSVGGIVGNISNMPNDESEPGQQELGVIKNCYSNVGITLKTQGVVSGIFTKKDGRIKYHTGGIVGTIVKQKKWPENCLYEGSIQSKGYIGPIFGALIGNSQVEDSSGFKKYWNGNDLGNGLTANKIYYSDKYRANNQAFNKTVKQGNSNVQIGTGSNSIEQVQGVNKGIYKTNMNQILNDFNTEANTSNLYCTWEIVGGQFTFKERLTTKIEENPIFTFNVVVTDPYNIGNYTYKWYKDGQHDTSIVGNKYTWVENYEKDEKIVVLTYDGTYYSANKFIIRRISVDIVFDINEPNRNVTSRLEGEGMKYTTVADYKFQWYKIDISGGEEIISGETTLNLNNLEDYTEYKLVATNTNKPKLSTENSFIFKGRNVVYVNYNTGSDNNNGRTDRTPVRTYSTAYSKLESNAPREKNIIVVMGGYNESSAYNTETGSTYRKNATITGKYRGKEYNGELVLHDSGNNYRFLNGDTTFQYIKLKGEGQSVYFYLQGYNLTVGEQVIMNGYANADSRQGLLGNNAPAFHLIAGWLKYDETTLPKNNTKILIKSGNYGRILGGGSPGLSGGSELVQRRSHNFMGSSKEDSFNIEITVDIKNSTKLPKYSYDVNLLVGGSACGNNYSNVTENIKSGTVGRLLGGSIGDSSDRPEEGGWWNPQPIQWDYPINTFLGTANINISGGEVAELYGGCLGRNMNALNSGGRGDYICDSYFYGTSTINITGGNITNNIYGAGAGGVTGYHQTSSDKYKEAANFPSNASPNSIPSAYNTEIDINITGGTVGGNIYGGGYGYTEYLTESTTAQDAGALYGNSKITIGGTAKIIGNVYGAGCGYNYGSKTELAKMIGTSTIQINGTPDIQGQIFGAGQGVSGKAEMAKLDGTSNVTIVGNLNTQVYGGGNISKTIGTTNVNINSGTHTQDIYGGGNQGIIEGTANVNVNGGTSERIFGGGNQATVTNSNVNINGGTNNQVFSGGNLAEVTNPLVNINGGRTQEVYGGGNEASAGTTKIYLKGGIANNIYGGSNQQGTVQQSIIETTTGTANNIYGGNNLGGITNNSNVQIKGGNIVEAIYGGGNQVQTTTTNIEITKSDNKVPYIFGGGNQAGATTTNIIANGGTGTNIFGGSNKQGNVHTSNVTINNGNYDNVYGGNNAGGKTITTNVNIQGPGATNVFGGGNQAVTNVTNVTINGNVKGSIYGGGNQAGVETNTNLDIIGGTISQNAYGGGNEGTVAENTYVHVKNANLKSGVYAGGNGTTAIVYGNTNILVDGTTTNIEGSVFGGGNKAETGTEATNNSISTVNIAGGTIQKNVYGGANTSVVYGKTITNIGKDSITYNGLEPGDVLIKGTIFGGGQANASGDEVYDFSFISVTKAIDIHINGNGHTNFAILGSIFGSGNASSTTGTSKIDIKNYGTFDKPQSNVSLQRTNLATISNSAITLEGATDRTNEYATTFFSISRVDRVKLMDNSTLFLCNGANLLTKLESVAVVNGVEEKSKAIINKDTGEVTERNVDNRIYMLEGKNLNIATNQQVTAYGQVSGMMFLGLFTNIHNPPQSTAIYNRAYNNGDTVTNEGTFILNSYVLGEHMANHNIEVDGFYSNYNIDGKIRTNYIDTTPKEDFFYMWYIGEKKDVTVFDIGLIASKYATLGTHELLLKGFSNPNIKFSIVGFSAGLKDGVELVDPNTIKPIEPDDTLANTKFGLAIRTGNVGWSTKGKTTFYTKDGGTYTGTKDYNKDNTGNTPTISICLYHPENISKAKNIGEAKIRLQALTPIDDLNMKVQFIDINITMVSKLFQDDFYEAAITPGQEFGLFTTSETVISGKSAFSTYYSLYIDNFPTNKHFQGYQTNKRVLVSRDQNQLGYAFPQDTKITMLDMVTNQYYYYIVTQQDEQTGKSIYPLSEFKVMGSTNTNYNEQEAITHYYDSGHKTVYENFIFHVNFADTNLANDLIDNTLLMEMQDLDNNTLIGVLGIQRDTMKYSVYNNQEGIIRLSGTLDKNPLYIGQKLGMDVTTDFNQLVVNSKTVYDTHYFDQKLGIKISIYDSNGKRLNNDTLLGVNFELDGQKYYPRIDGTTRIKIADKVSNVLARIKMNTEQNKVIPTGEYTIKVESFGSPDGIYYGINSSDTIEMKVKIINSTYGLKARTTDQEKIIDSVTGKTTKGTNQINVNLEYQSLYTHPEIRVALYRRDYNDIFSLQYNLVNLQDYVTETLNVSTKENEYIAFDVPTPNSTQTLTFKENLITGTYKLEYKLYDGNTYIGEAYEYIVIK